MIYINQCPTDASHKLLNKCELKPGLPVDPDFLETQALEKHPLAETHPHLAQDRGRRAL